jgi:hypothetical protein
MVMLRRRKKNDVESGEGLDRRRNPLVRLEGSPNEERSGGERLGQDRFFEN